jgi:hypothetical protein
MYIYVNQKEINGIIYTAVRDDENPRKQGIECDGEVKECRLKDIWSSNDKIIKLWQ